MNLDKDMQNKLDLKQGQNKLKELTELQQKQIVQQQSKLKTNLEKLLEKRKGNVICNNFKR